MIFWSIIKMYNNMYVYKIIIYNYYVFLRVISCNVFYP